MIIEAYEHWRATAFVTVALVFSVFCILTVIRGYRLIWKIQKFEKVFWSGKPIDEIYNSLKDKNFSSLSPAQRAFASMIKEWRIGFTQDGKAFPNTLQKCRDAGNMAKRRWFYGAKLGLLPFEILEVFLGPIFGITAALLGIIATDTFGMESNSEVNSRIRMIFEISLAATLISSSAFIVYRVAYSRIELANEMLADFIVEFSSILERSYREAPKWAGGDQKVAPTTNETL